MKRRPPSLTLAPSNNPDEILERIEAALTNGAAPAAHKGELEEVIENARNDYRKSTSPSASHDLYVNRISRSLTLLQRLTAKFNDLTAEQKTLQQSLENFYEAVQINPADPSPDERVAFYRTTAAFLGGGERRLEPFGKLKDQRLIEKAYEDLSDFCQLQESELLRDTAADLLNFRYEILKAAQNLHRTLETRERLQEQGVDLHPRTPSPRVR